MKNILEICQDAANLICVQAPQTLFGSNSQNDKIFLSVAKDALNGLLRFGDWQELVKDGELKTTENKTDYLIKAFCPDFFKLLNNTVYLKDANEKIIGAITPEQWQREKYLYDDNSQIKFKIQNSMFRFLTPPPEGTKIVFQYRSSVVAFDKGLFVEKTEITKDTDIPVFDEYLVKLAIRWRMQARNGQAYQEDFNEYERECRKCLGAGKAGQNILLGLGGCEWSDGGIAYVKSSN